MFYKPTSTARLIATVAAATSVPPFTRPSASSSSIPPRPLPRALPHIPTGKTLQMPMGAQKAASPPMKSAILLVSALSVIPLFVFTVMHHGAHSPWQAVSSLSTISISPPTTTTTFTTPLNANIAPDPTAAGPRCVFYDRPPRTGSTTISTTLAVCLRRRGYVVLPASASGRNVTRHTVLPRLSTAAALSPSAHVASVIQHAYVTTEQFSALHASCGFVFYITSAASMLPRLLSMVKYSTFEGHLNATINAALLARLIVRKARNLRYRETFFEDYPYVDHANLNAGLREKDRVMPHYVVRQDAIVHDLGALLRALKCGDVAIQSANVHDVDFGDDDDEAAFKQALVTAGDVLAMGDHRYTRMLQLVKKRNSAGLVLAESL